MKRKLFLGTLLGFLATAHAQQTYSTTTTFDDPTIEPSSVPYQFGFESALAGEGWTTILTSGIWDVFTSDPDLPAYQGEGVVGIYGGMDPIDSWLFSRGIELESGQKIDISYFMQKKAIWATGGVHSYKVSIGTSTTAAGQTTVLATLTDVPDVAYQQKTHEFTAPAAGVYYVGFHNESPAHQADNYGALLIDNFSVKEATAGLKENELSQLAIFPNPSDSDITITTEASAIISDAMITDINGRIVRSYKIGNANSTTISVRDLTAGIYMLKVSSDKGVATRKIIKK